MNRLNATLNFICTYEKVVTINNTIIDIIEEFDIKDNKAVLYGYKNTYEFIFPKVDINIEGVNVYINFYGDAGGSVCF